MQTVGRFRSCIAGNSQMHPGGTFTLWGVEGNVEVDVFRVVGERYVPLYPPAAIHWSDPTQCGFWGCLAFLEGL